MTVVELVDQFQFFDINRCSHTIKLCEGDVTKPAESFDFLLVSAIKGDYRPYPRTCMAAINNIGIDLAALSSKNKKKDMDDNLSNFLCWSTPPKINGKFNRVLCFETNSSTVIVNELQKIFFFLALKHWDECGHVISPVLASGCQKLDDNLILRVIILNCFRAMLLGLPMASFSLVFYNKASPANKDTFEELKSDMQSFIDNLESSCSIEVLILHSTEDKPFLQSIIADSHLKEIKANSEVTPENEKISDRILQPIQFANKIIIYDRQHFIQDFYKNFNCISACFSAYIQQRSSQNQLELLTVYRSSMPNEFSFVNDLPKLMKFEGFQEIRKLDDEAAAYLIDLFPNPRLEFIKTLQFDHSSRDPQVTHFTILYLSREAESKSARLVSEALRNQHRDAIVEILDTKNDDVLHLSKTVAHIEQSSVIIAILSDNFFNDDLCSRLYGIAQCCHQSDAYPTQLVTFSNEESFDLTEETRCKLIQDSVIFPNSSRRSGDSASCGLVNEVVAQSIAKSFQVYGNTVVITGKELRPTLLKQPVDFDFLNRVATDHLYDRSQNTEIKSAFLFCNHKVDEKFRKEIQQEVKQHFTNIEKNNHVEYPLASNVKDIRREIQEVSIDSGAEQNHVVVIIGAKFWDDHCKDILLACLTLPKASRTDVRLLLLDPPLPDNIPMYVKRFPILVRESSQDTSQFLYDAVSWLKHPEAIDLAAECYTDILRPVLRNERDGGALDLKMQWDVCD